MPRGGAGTRDLLALAAGGPQRPSGERGGDFQIGFDRPAGRRRLDCQGGRRDHWGLGL
jgi:hypothetical protein